MKKHLFGLFAALLGSAALAGPGEPPVLPPNIAVDINAPGAVRAVIAISIPSLKEEKRYTLAVSDGALVGGIYVPPGQENKVSVTALDARGETLYWGSSYLSVSEKFNPQVDIELTGKETKDPLTAKFGTYRLALELAANEGDGLMLQASLFDAAGKHLTINPEEVIWRGMPEKFEVLPYSCFGGSACFEMPDLTVYEAMMACMADVVCSHTKPKDSRGPYLHVAVGRNHTCALTVKNDIVCWGDNRAGQLRSTPTTCPTGQPSDCSTFPLQVVCGMGEVCKFQSVAAGAEMTCAVDTDGKAWCWGRHGDPATGEIALSSRAEAINAEIVAIDANEQKVLFTTIDTDLTKSCALSTTRELYCWSHSTTSLDDHDVHNKGTLYKSVSVGKRHVCAQTVGGKMDCFGDNTDGQITGSFPLPAPVNPVLEQIFKRGGHVPSAGATSSCAQDPDDNTICWGSPEATAPWATPPTGGWIALWRSYATTLSSNSHMCQVAPGTFFPCTRICATALGGDLFCGTWRWSGGAPSQLTNLGDPPSEHYISWTQVDGPNHVCAVTNQRDIWCFGMNDVGQFGTGTTSTVRTEEPAIPSVRFNNEIATLKWPLKVFP